MNDIWLPNKHANVFMMKTLWEDIGGKGVERDKEAKKFDENTQGGIVFLAESARGPTRQSRKKTPQPFVKIPTTTA